MNPLARIYEDPDPLVPPLLDVLTGPVGLTSAGYPFLEHANWELFRDRVPHLFSLGLRVLRHLREILARLEGSELPVELQEKVRLAARVVTQITQTAAITAPPNLWLLRHVLAAWKDLGLLERLRHGEALYPSHCPVVVDGEERKLKEGELTTDLEFLLALGLVESYDNSYRLAGHPRVQRILDSAEPLEFPADLSRLWIRAFAGEILSTEEVEILLNAAFSTPRRNEAPQNHWIPTVEEIGIGYRLVPLVLGLRANDLTVDLQRGRHLGPQPLGCRYPQVFFGALEILTGAGWLERMGERFRVTELGERGFSRGSGPFGIIETYHSYMAHGVELLLEDHPPVWVNRRHNIGASQDANRGRFRRANDALDRFCADTGFRYGIFVEHAIGRGEATRQRFEREGGADLWFFGADLEDAAIDAVEEEQRQGNLPQKMTFVRQADIGKPDILVRAIRATGRNPEGAVMMVGNGFHEVRHQEDGRMVEVFRGYAEAGIVLLFTEENALSVDDLRSTAWNTYHAGFKYVHEKSGQGLRPARPGPSPRVGRPLRAPWSECAREAGYVRLDEYCTRSRTIYPTAPPDGFNPSISVNHFYAPQSILDKLASKDIP